jgi:hypothetical protein
MGSNRSHEIASNGCITGRKACLGGANDRKSNISQHHHVTKLDQCVMRRTQEEQMPNAHSIYRSAFHITPKSRPLFYTSKAPQPSSTAVTTKIDYSPSSLFLFRATSTAPLGSLDAGLVALDLRLTHTHHTAGGFPWPLELAYCRLTKQMDLH